MRQIHAKCALASFAFMLALPALAAADAEADNKAVINQLIQHINERDTEGLKALYTANAVSHTHSGAPAERHGAEELGHKIGEWQETYPDYALSAEDLFAAGDRVALRFLWTGTNQEYGKKVDIPGSVIYRFEESKIAESWVAWDELSVVQALGFTVTAPEAMQETTLSGVSGDAAAAVGSATAAAEEVVEEAAEAVESAADAMEKVAE